MRSPIVQNDTRLPEQIQAAGCLLRCLSMGAEIQAQNTLTTDQITQHYQWLVDNERMKANCWVLNHPSVITATQFYLNQPQKALYVFRDEGGDGTDFDTGVPPNFWIRHVRLNTGNGHFQVADRNGGLSWDPFWPAPAIDYIIGIRGYRIG